MTTPLPLDTRQARIARRLLETIGPASVDDLATELKLTDRMVRYNLASVDSVLAEHGLRLARRRGVGIWVEGSPAARQGLLDALDRSTGPAVLDPTDRRGRILLALLDRVARAGPLGGARGATGRLAPDDPARHARGRGLARAAPAPPPPDAGAGHRRRRQRDRPARRPPRPRPGDRPGRGPCSSARGSRPAGPRGEPMPRSRAGDRHRDRPDRRRRLPRVASTCATFRTILGRRAPRPRRARPDRHDRGALPGDRGAPDPRRSGGPARRRPPPLAARSPASASAARIATAVERAIGVAARPDRRRGDHRVAARADPARRRRGPARRPSTSGTSTGSSRPPRPGSTPRSPTDEQLRTSLLGARPAAPRPAPVRAPDQQSAPAGGPQALPGRLPRRGRDPRRGRARSPARRCRSRRSAC